MTTTGMILVELILTLLWLMATPICGFLVYLKYKDEDWRAAWSAGHIALIAVIATCLFGYILLPEFLYELERAK